MTEDEIITRIIASTDAEMKEKGIPKDGDHFREWHEILSKNMDKIDKELGFRRPITPEDIEDRLYRACVARYIMLNRLKEHPDNEDDRKAIQVLHGHIEILGWLQGKDIDEMINLDEEYRKRIRESAKLWTEANLFMYPIDICTWDEAFKN